MSSNGHPVIKLEGVTKVFFTDEVETHALSRWTPERACVSTSSVKKTLVTPSSLMTG